MSMKKSFWLINFRTQKYVPYHTLPPDFFATDDWPKKTPLGDDPDNVFCQSVWHDQKQGDHLFYGYDLCRDGMIVGVYYDKDKVTKQEVDDFVRNLKRNHDVVSLRKFPLTRDTSSGMLWWVADDEQELVKFTDLVARAGGLMLSTDRTTDPPRIHLVFRVPKNEATWEALGYTPDDEDWLDE